MQPLLVAKGFVKRYGGLLVTDHVDLDVRGGELHALIGPNGAGKTTLLNMLSGQISPDSGQLFFAGVNITNASTAKRALAGIVRSFQIASIIPEFTALENVMLSVQSLSGNSYDVVRDVRCDSRLTEPALAALEEVGLAAQADVAASSLAHGARRQLEVAMVLAMCPKVMLLDEPLAGMSGAEAKAMTALLARLKGTYGIVLVEHDMDAVFALSDRVTVLVYGKVIATGAPAEVRENPEVHQAYLGMEEPIDEFG